MTNKERMDNLDRRMEILEKLILSLGTQPITIPLETYSLYEATGGCPRCNCIPCLCHIDSTFRGVM